MANGSFPPYPLTYSPFAPMDPRAIVANPRRAASLWVPAAAAPPAATVAAAAAVDAKQPAAFDADALIAELWGAHEPLPVPTAAARRSSSSLASATPPPPLDDSAHASNSTAHVHRAAAQHLRAPLPAIVIGHAPTVHAAAASAAGDVPALEPVTPNVHPAMFGGAKQQQQQQPAATTISPSVLWGTAAPAAAARSDAANATTTASLLAPMSPVSPLASIFGPMPTHAAAAAAAAAFADHQQHQQQQYKLPATATSYWPPAGFPHASDSGHAIDAGANDDEDDELLSGSDSDLDDDEDDGDGSGAYAPAPQRNRAAASAALPLERLSPYLPAGGSLAPLPPEDEDGAEPAAPRAGRGAAKRRRSVADADAPADAPAPKRVSARRASAFASTAASALPAAGAGGGGRATDSKRAKDREYQRLSRARRAAHLADLETRVVVLANDNRRLHAENERLKATVRRLEDAVGRRGQH